jgi:hypothetical protein
MATHKRTTNEIINELQDQLAALRASTKGYDEGHRWESKRLATVAYTLLHDGTGRTKSLLGQIGWRNKIKYLDSVDATHHEALRNGLEGNFLPFSPLTIFIYNLDTDDGNVAPRLENGFHGKIKSTSKSFSDWYEGTVYISSDGIKFSRKNLIFSMRSQDGGAHYDSEIRNDAYRELSTVWTKKLRMGTTNGFNEPQAHFAAMRQIAWEIDESVKLFMATQR